MGAAQGRITVHRRPKDGEQGEVGISYRVSYWQSGKQYRNDLSLTGGQSQRFVDICVNKPLSLIGDSDFKAYQCIQTHTSTDSIPLGASGYWTTINNLQPLVTPLILAKKIVADYIDVDTLYVKHLDAADGVFNGSFSAEATHTEEKTDYVHTLEINPNVIRITAYSDNHSQAESVTIWPLPDPDRYDRTGLVEIEGYSNDSVAVVIKGRVQGLRTGIQKVYSSETIDGRYETILVLTSSAVTLTLPSSIISEGQKYKIMNISGAAITLTHPNNYSRIRIKGDGNSGTLVSSKTFTSTINSLDLICDGTYWFVVTNNS
ncbi:MAG: hypothetical protein ACI3ZT_05375 [Candidatus Cryptobacteroides sp.]